MGIDNYRKTQLSGPGSRRSLESAGGSMRRAARRLRRKGFARAAEQMALQAEQQWEADKAARGGRSIRDADAEVANRDLAERSSRMQRALAAGYRPPTQAATGDLLKQRKSLFEEMKAAREAGKDPGQFRDRATDLGITSSGFETAMSKLPKASEIKPAAPPPPPGQGGQQPTTQPGGRGGAQAPTPVSPESGTGDAAPTSPVPGAPTSPAGPNAPAGGSPNQGAGSKPATVGGGKGNTTTITKPDGTPVLEGEGELSAETPAAGTASPSPAEPPAGQSTMLPEERRARIDGLTPDVATSIAEQYGNIPSRVQKVLEQGKKLGIYKDESDAKDIEASLKRKLNAQAKDEILKDLRKNEPLLADEYENYYNSSSVLNPDSDPREVLNFVREKLEEEDLAGGPQARQRRIQNRISYLKGLRTATGRDDPEGNRFYVGDAIRAYESGTVPEGADPRRVLELIKKRYSPE